MRTTGWLRLGMLTALLPLAAACDDDSNLTGVGGGAAAPVSLSVSTGGQGGGSAALAGPAAFDIVVSDGASTLTITRVAMVLREIELERAFDDDCDDHLPGEDDDCEEFEVGPMLLELPLDGGVEQVASISSVDADTYDEVEFEIHKPSDDSAEDLAFIAANPDFADVSIRVEGDFNGAPFLYLSDLNADQEYALVPPLVVDAATTAVNLTLSIDVATWFVGPGGIVIDPSTANKGGPNENLVEDNIEASIEVFEDDDRDGEHD